MAISKPSPSLQSSLSLSNDSSSFPERLHPVRRVSEFDIVYPPRYSTPIGASTHLSPAPFNNIATHDDNDILPPRPPAYSTGSQPSNSLEPPDASSSTVSSRSRSVFLTHHSRNGIQVHRYHYHINGSKAGPWATLKIHCDSPNQNGQNTPHFTNGDLIRGVVELNLDTPQNINSNSLSVSNNNNNVRLIFIYFSL